MNLIKIEYFQHSFRKTDTNKNIVEVSNELKTKYLVVSDEDYIEIIAKGMSKDFQELVSYELVSSDVEITEKVITEQYEKLEYKHNI